MRAIFNFIKDVCRAADGIWIESAGHPITVKGIFRRKKDDNELYIEDAGEFIQLYPEVLIYGFYDYPQLQQTSVFGIDAPDELEVQVNIAIVSDRLGGTPEIGTLLSIEDGDWIVINRSYIYNRFVGKYRLALNCARFQRSVTTGISDEIEESI